MGELPGRSGLRSDQMSPEPGGSILQGPVDLALSGYTETPCKSQTQQQATAQPTPVENQAQSLPQQTTVIVETRTNLLKPPKP